MNWIGILSILIGVVYLVYSILYRSKVTWYTKRVCKKSEMKLIKSDEFLRLQLIFSVCSAIYLIGYGVLITVFNVYNIFIISLIYLFYFINFLLVVQSKKKGYIDYKTVKIYK